MQFTKKDLANISLEKDAAAKIESTKELWPTAKESLTQLKDIVKNPFVKWMITAVINFGDKIFA